LLRVIIIVRIAALLMAGMAGLSTELSTVRALSCYAKPDAADMQRRERCARLAHAATKQPQRPTEPQDDVADDCPETDEHDAAFTHWLIGRWDHGNNGTEKIGLGYHRGGMVLPFFFYGSYGADASALIVKDGANAGQLSLRGRLGGSPQLIIGAGLELSFSAATTFSGKVHPSWSFGFIGIGFAFLEAALVGEWTIATQRPAWLAETSLGFRVNVPLPGGFPWKRSVATPLER
jgi:hypothetical protein